MRRRKRTRAHSLGMQRVWRRQCTLLTMTIDVKKARTAPGGGTPVPPPEAVRRHATDSSTQKSETPQTKKSLESATKESTQPPPTPDPSSPTPSPNCAYQTKWRLRA